MNTTRRSHFKLKSTIRKRTRNIHSNLIASIFFCIEHFIMKLTMRLTVEPMMLLLL